MDQNAVAHLLSLNGFTVRRPRKDGSRTAHRKILNLTRKLTFTMDVTIQPGGNVSAILRRIGRNGEVEHETPYFPDDPSELIRAATILAG